MRIRNLQWAIVAVTILAFAAPSFVQTQSKTGTQFYMEYVAAFAKAKGIEEIFPYMAAENRKQAEATPKAERDKMFEMIKMLGHTDIKVLKEEAGPSGGATLSVEGIDSDKKKSTGTVTLIKEGGAWKIQKESWTTKG
jgi:hypothetical protein